MSENNKLVVVVTGASRGIGKGIALELGGRGATVYVIGRSSGDAGRRSPGGHPLPGTIEEAAEEVTSAGGEGIAVACDLANDTEIKALFDRVRADHGRLDILVNNAAVLHEEMGRRPFWEAPVDLADIISVGLRCHHISTYYAAPLLIASERGLIVNISFYNNAELHDPAYYAAKAGLDQLATSYARDFRPHNVAALSLWPGFTRTERAGGDVGNSSEIAPGMGVESTAYTGRVIRAPWEDPDLMALTGKTLIGAEVGARYGVADLPGFRPLSLRARLGSPHPQRDLAP